MNPLVEIFEYNDEGWGLRGDPHMWEELKIHFQKIQETSLNAEEFDLLLEKKFNEIIELKGKRHSDDMVSFEHFPQQGMSGGYISLTQWNETLIPMLKEKYRELKESKI